MIALVATSAAANSPYAVEDFDLDTLQNGTATSATAVFLPGHTDVSALNDGTIKRESVRKLGASGHAQFYTALNDSGELCLVASVEVSTTTPEEWAIATSCTSPSSFNTKGLALQVSTPSDGVETYLLPDKVAAALGAQANEFNAGSSNLVAVGINASDHERHEMVDLLAQAGITPLQLDAELSYAE